jgi:uncharacterized protein YwgA
MVPNKNGFLNDVLFALYSADELKWPALGRTHLQRILYLCAALSALSDTEWGYEFSNTRFGPFNAEISQAPDDLVHQRYAEAVKVSVQKDSRMKASFKITPSGKQRVQIITSLKQESRRLAWIGSVMEILTVYGPAVMSKLAYLEPTLTRMKAENRQGPIDLSTEDNQSIQLLERLGQGLKQNFQIALETATSNMIVFFDYLSRDIGRSDPV